MIRYTIIAILLLLGFYVAWPAFSGFRIYQALRNNEPEVLQSKIDFPSVRRSMRGPVLAQVNTRIETVMRDLGPATKMIGGAIPRDNIERIIDGALDTVITPAKVADIYSKGGNFNAAIREAVLNEIDKMGGLMKVLRLDKLLATAGNNSTGADGSASGSGNGDLNIGGFRVSGSLAKGLSGLLKNKEMGNAVLGDLVAKFGLDAGKIAEKLFPKQRAAGEADADAGANGKRRSFGIGNVKSFGFAGPFALQLGLARSSQATKPELTTEMTFRNYDWRITKMTPDLLER